jgi:hypothetical protein
MGRFSVVIGITQSNCSIAFGTVVTDDDGIANYLKRAQELSNMRRWRHKRRGQIATPSWDDLDYDDMIKCVFQS